jgi:hypothetical protein
MNGGTGGAMPEDADARKNADQVSKLRYQSGPYIGDNLDAQYKVPSTYLDLREVVQACGTDSLHHDFRGGPALYLDDHVNIQAKYTDFGNNVTTRRSHTDAKDFVVGMNPNVRHVDVRVNNSGSGSTTHEAYSQMKHLDHSNAAGPPFTNITANNTAVSVLLDATQATALRHERIPDLDVNRDPTGFAHQVIARAALHNIAIRETNHNGTPRRLNQSEPTTANTMLWWPVAAQVRHDEVEGATMELGGDGTLQPDSVLAHGLMLLSQHVYRSVRVRVSANNAPTSATYDVMPNDSPTVGIAKAVRQEDDDDPDTIDYYLSNRGGIRTWIGVPAVDIFVAPEVQADIDLADGTLHNKVRYFIGHLPGQKHECSFLLGRAPTGTTPLMPGSLGVIQQVSAKSYAPQQTVQMIMDSGKAEPNWAILPRLIVSTAMQLLRGYGVATWHYDKALVAMAETAGATYFLDCASGYPAAQPVVVRLPPVTTYLVQGMRAMNSYATSSPKELGLGKNFSHLHRMVGFAISHTANMWLGSQGQKMVSSEDVPGNATVERVARKLSRGKYADLSAIDERRHANSAVGTEDWRQTHCAASMLSKYDAEKVLGIARLLYDYGSNSDVIWAGLRTCISKFGRSRVFKGRSLPLADHSINTTLEFESGSAHKEWHQVPQRDAKIFRTTNGLVGAKVAQNTAIGVALRALPLLGRNATSDDCSANTMVMHAGLYYNMVGTIEQAMSASWVNDKIEMTDLAARVLRASGNNGTGIEPVMAVLAISNSTDREVRFAKLKHGEAGIDQLTVRGSAGIGAIMGIAHATKGMIMAPNHEGTGPSSVTFSMNMTREAIANKSLAVNSVSYSTIVYRSMRTSEHQPHTLLTEASAGNVTLAKSMATHLGAYDPSAGVCPLHIEALHVSSKPMREARYHAVSELAPTVAADFRMARFTCADVTPVAGEEKTESWRVLAQNRRAGRKLKAPKEDKGDTKPGGSQGGIVAPQPPPPVTKTVPVTTVGKLLVELVQGGLDTRMYTQFMAWVLHCKERIKDKITPSLGAQGKYQPHPMGTVGSEFVIEQMQYLGFPGVFKDTTAPELVNKLLATNAPLTKELREYIMNTSQASMIRRTVTAVEKYVRDAEPLVNLTELVAPVVTWRQSGDAELQRLANDVIRQCIKLHEEPQGHVTYFSYRNDTHAEATWTDEGVRSVMNAISERAKLAGSVGTTELFAPANLSKAQLAMLPMARINRVIVPFAVGLRRPDDWWGTARLLVKSLNQAFVLDAAHSDPDNTTGVNAEGTVLSVGIEVLSAKQAMANGVGELTTDGVNALWLMNIAYAGRNYRVNTSAAEHLRDAMEKYDVHQEFVQNELDPDSELPYDMSEATAKECVNKKIY